jgi:hypothetical protein
MVEFLTRQEWLARVKSIPLKQREQEAARRNEAFREELCQRAAAFRQLHLANGPVALRDAHILLTGAQIEEALFQGVLEMWRGSEWAFPPRTTLDEFLIPYIDKGAVLEYLRLAVSSEIQRGRMAVSGLAISEAATGKRRTFAADRWGMMVPDWDNDRARCEGQIVVVGVTVEAARPKNGRKTQPTSRKLVKGWLERQVKQWQVEGKIPDRDIAYDKAQAAFPGFKDREWFRAEMKKLVRRDRGRPRRKLAAKENGS